MDGAETRSQHARIGTNVWCLHGALTPVRCLILVGAILVQTVSGDDQATGPVTSAPGEVGVPAEPVDVSSASGSSAGSDRLSVLEQRVEELTNRLEDREPVAREQKPDYPSAKITGFTQFDSGWYAQDANNMATVGDAQDGAGFRRARVAVFGKVAAFTNYQLEVDFATAGRPSFFDNFVEQENIPFLGTVRAGQYLQPFSVDAVSGFRHLPFLERSLPFLAFVPFRRVGIMASQSTDDELTHWAYSVFRTGGFNNAPLGDDRYATDFGDVGGYSFCGRAMHLLQYDECDGGDNFWQIGGGYNYSRLGANDAIGSGTPGNAGSPQPFYLSRVTPEFFLGLPENSTDFGIAANGTPAFASTGRYAASSFNLWGLETVYQSGPFSFQAEWMATQVNSVVGPVFYHGAYGEVMYRLTGEHRGYDRKLGALRNPVPFRDFISFSRERRGIRGWGAWELAARWSFVDLRNPESLDGHYYDSASNTFTGTSNSGNGILHDATIGVTWFLNAHTKLQFNWIHAMLDNSFQGRSSADLYVTRIQVDF